MALPRFYGNGFIILVFRANVKSGNPTFKTAQVLRESMETLDEVERLFTEGVRDAGERAAEGVTRMNEENVHVSDRVYSFTPADFEKPITLRDINKLREIVNSSGDISINQFTSKEIEKAQKWAYKFYRELGTKSPFFRAWFGDWRAYDKNRINIVSVPTIDISEVSLANGNYWIEDTKWEVYAGKTLNDDTRHHSGGQRINVKALTAFDAILENAVLLDTIVSKPDTKKKSDNTAFLHKLYTIIKYEGKTYIAKTTVEEFYNETTNGVSRRAYNLKAIKIEPAGGQLGNESSSSRPDTSSMEANTSVGIGESHTPIIEDTASDISIADLFAFVKQYDKEFSPKPVNELMLNDDGTPKVFYHGTNADFTVFDYGRIGESTGVSILGDGFYFTDKKEMADRYGKQTMACYVRMSKPYTASPDEAYNLNTDELEKQGYDGVILEAPQGNVYMAFDNSQIKSATDNIGTFDGTNPDIRYSIDDSADVSGSEAADNQAALERFGTTTDFEQAGFAMADGRMLKLSQYGGRGVQHRVIEGIYEDTKGDEAIGQTKTPEAMLREFGISCLFTEWAQSPGRCAYTRGR